MICTHCQSRCTRVIDSRKTYDEDAFVPDRLKSMGIHLVYRRHYCNKCGKTFPTVQLSEQDLSDIDSKIRGNIASEIINNIELTN